MDNILPDMKLLTALKYLAISRYETAKAGPGFPFELLEICKLSTNKPKKDWNIRGLQVSYYYYQIQGPDNDEKKITTTTTTATPTITTTITTTTTTTTITTTIRGVWLYLCY